jgi:CBS-domain-containing membrane protein
MVFADAAVLMLKHKIHRIPVVNEEDKLVGESRQLHTPSGSCFSGLLFVSRPRQMLAGRGIGGRCFSC